MTYQTIATIYLTGLVMMAWVHCVMLSMEDEEDEAERNPDAPNPHSFLSMAGTAVFWPFFVVVMSIAAWMNEMDRRAERYSDGTNGED